MNNKKIKIKKIEVDLTNHCNLKCNCCDHASNILPEKFNSVNEIIQDLDEITKHIEIEELLIAGGEPLLHKDILLFLREVNKRKDTYGKNVTLITNGLLLHKAPEEIWELINGIWISIYPNVKIKENYPNQFSDLAEKHNIWVWEKETDIFTKTFLNNKNTDNNLVDFIYKTCVRSHVLDCHVIRSGRYFKCTPAPFIGNRLEMNGKAFDNIKEDSIQIQDNPNLREDLKKYLSDTNALKACSYCLGGLGKEIKHAQITDPKISLKEDDSNILTSLNKNILTEIVKATKQKSKLKNAGNIIFANLKKLRNCDEFAKWDKLKEDNIGKVFSMNANLKDLESDDSTKKSILRKRKKGQTDQITAFRFVLRYCSVLTLIYNFSFLLTIFKKRAQQFTKDQNR